MKKICFILVIIFLSSIVYFPSQFAEAKTTKEIYLTFDDGPSLVTCEILKVLKEYKVTATFFVVGKCVEKNPKILKDIYANGNSIGIHSYSHEYKSIYKDKQSLLEDIYLCERSIKNILPNFCAKIYRFPGGSFNLREETKFIPQSINLKYYDWNASVCDAEGITYSPYQLFQNAINTTFNRNKVILLCHDCAGKHSTALALPDIIKWFKSMGYTFKTL